MSETQYIAGIDIGTTYCAAAVAYGDGRVETITLGSTAASIPSVVYLREDGAFLVGEAAEQRGTSEPGRIAREFKRRLGDPAPILLGGSPFPSHELMARLIGWVVEKVSEREGRPPARVQVTHPANWGEYKLDFLRRAIESAGIAEFALISEPEAAAVHYAAQERVELGSLVAVYDLGGGTFDVAVLRKVESGFEFVGEPQGIESLGGIDFDYALVQWVLAQVGDDGDLPDADDPAVRRSHAQLRRDCIAAKIALSSDTEAVIPVTLPGMHTQLRITRAEFEDLIRPSLAPTVSTLQRALDRSGVEVGDLHNVLLVGGSSRIPAVGEMVATELRRPVAVDVDPKHGVALGAARSGLAPQVVTHVDDVDEESDATVEGPEDMGGTPHVASVNEQDPPTESAGSSGQSPTNRFAVSPQLVITGAALAVIVALVIFFGMNRGGSSGNGAEGGDGDAFAGSAGTADPGLSPIRLGLLTGSGGGESVGNGARAAAALLNADRDGIGGHPLELVECQQNSPETIQACIDEFTASDVVGLIDGFNAADRDVLAAATAAAGLRILGGIPLFVDDMRPENSHYFYGGGFSASTGVAAYVADSLEASAVSVLVTEQSTSAEMVDVAFRPMLEARGVAVEVIGVPIDSIDATDQARQAMTANPASVVAFVSDEQCRSVIEARAETGFTGDLVLPGSCADPQRFSEVGDSAVGTRYQFELAAQPLPDAVVPEASAGDYAAFVDAMRTHGQGALDVSALSSIGFSSVVNIHNLFEDIGVDDLDNESIAAALNRDVARRNFLTTPYNCRAAPSGFPAACHGGIYLVERTVGGIEVVEDDIDGFSLMDSTGTG